MKKLKNLKKFSILFLILFMWIATVIPVSAATHTQDGVQITLTTDKQKYDLNEKITAVVAVKNMNDCAVENVSLESVILSGYQAEGDATLTIPTLTCNGGNATWTVVLVPKTGTAPVTGDSNNIMCWMLLLISAAVLLAGGCILYRKKNGKILSLFLCIAMVVTLVPTNALEVNAAKVTRTASVSETIDVGTRKDVIESKIIYTFPESADEVYGYVTESGNSTETGNGTESSDTSGNTEESSSGNREELSGNGAADEEAPIQDGDESETAGNSSRMDALLGHMETALKYARNIEGAYYPQLFVDGLNVDTYEPTQWNKGSSSATTSSNLYAQFNFLKALDGMTLLTGDSKYSEVAVEQISLRFDTPGLVDDNGLVYAGGHAFVDVITGQKQGLEYHETKDYQLPYELMYKADPEGTKRYITAFWNAHVYDWSSLIMNRHGYWNTAIGDTWDSEYTNPDPWVSADTAPFLSTGNDLLEAAWFMTEVTGDTKYAEWGERLLDKYIGVGNSETMLVGEQYGTMTDTSMYGQDRFLYSVMGADFVTNTGFDFKTATMDDYKLFGANSLVTRTSSKCNMAYGPQNYAEIYRASGNEKIYEFAKNNMLSWARYVYDSELHLYKTPILNDGTDLNEGEDGNQLIATKTGYYIKEGEAFDEYESVWSGALSGAVDTLSILKPEDADAYAEIWEAARAFAQNVGLGDIGTAMGENVNVDFDTTQTAPEYVQAIVKMYKYTGHPDYLELACNMADRIVANCYNAEKGMFIINKNSPYAALDTAQMYAVFMVEAASRGYVNEINLDLSHCSHDVPHDGMGQVTGSAVWFEKSKVDVENVKFDNETYSIIVCEEPNANFSDLTNAEEDSAIRQMASIKVLSAEEDGLFHPEKAITRGKLVEMVTRLFGFTDYEVPASFSYTDVSTSDSYYDALVAAVNAGILDENFGTDKFNANYEVTRAEMAAVIVRALQVKLPANTWNTGNALYRITDADTIPSWAKDYANIAVNYRLMVDLEDDTFEPGAVVTKDMAAGIFIEVARYITLPQVETILPEITPYNADTSKMFWESADASIVEVDQQGRLYPVSAGTTTVRVTSDGKYADITVTVALQENWMVKEVYIDGELYDDFNAAVLEYGINLDKGVYTVPTVTATSYTGEEVIVNVPASLPGTVEFYVKGTAVKYTLKINNDYIDYIIDENFNQETGTKIEEITTDRFNWFINGTTVAYKDRWVVTPRNSVDSSEEEYGCMVFPYDHKKNVEGQCYLILADTDRQSLGEEADDMMLVIEMEIAVKNIKGKENGFWLNFNKVPDGTYYSVARFLIDENGISRRKDSATIDRPTKRELEDGEFIHFKIVIDKKNRIFHYYYNDALLEKDIPFFHDQIQEFAAIYIGTPKEAEDSQAEMFIDNLKIYNLTHTAYEEMMSQEVAPPLPPKEEWLTNPIDEDYDDYKVGTTIQQTGQDHYIGHIAEGKMYGLATVVEKSVLDSTAEATDKMLEIKYNPNAETDGNFRYIFDTSIIHELGENADDMNLVVEMDVAVDGEGIKTNGYRLGISELLSSGYRSVARFLINDDEIARYKDAANIVDSTLRTSVTKGEFSHLKVVINKKTKQYSYYIDDVLIEKGLSALYSDISHVGVILFNAILEDETGLDSKLYVDNLKVYVEEPKEEGEPRPIPTPSEGPYLVNIVFDELELGKNLTQLSGTNWSGKVNEGNYAAYSKVVAKSIVDNNAAADDYCIEFTPLTNNVRALDLNFSVLIDEAARISVGNAVAEDRYAVVEMDLAMSGNDTKVNGFKVYLNSGANTVNYSLARFALFDTTFAHYTGSSTVQPEADRQAATEGQFTHFKAVIDRETKKVTYFWNGQLAATSMSAIHESDSTELGHIRFQIPYETLSGDAITTDSKFYVDNIKVYVTDESP